jgi:hypothetical protein
MKSFQKQYSECVSEKLTEKGPILKWSENRHLFSAFSFKSGHVLEDGNLQLINCLRFKNGICHGQNEPCVELRKKHKDVNC